MNRHDINFRYCIYESGNGTRAHSEKFIHRSVHTYTVQTFDRVDINIYQSKINVILKNKLQP